MSELAEIQKCLQEVAEHLKAGTKSEKRVAVRKLQRIAAIATTLSLTIETRG